MRSLLYATLNLDIFERQRGRIARLKAGANGYTGNINFMFFGNLRALIMFSEFSLKFYRVTCRGNEFALDYLVII